LKLAIGNESVHQNSKDNGVTIVKFAMSKNLVVVNRCSHTETLIITP